MPYINTTHLFALFAGLLASTQMLRGVETQSGEAPLKQLEERLSEITSKLEQVAYLTLRSGSGSIGYRSIAHQKAHHQEWVEIQLGKACLVEEIILVPTISRTTKSNVHADAFPREFRIWAGTEDDRIGQLIGEYKLDESLPKRIAPLALEVSPTTASWVQIEATQLSQRDYDGLYCLQLAEVMIFCDNKNVALNRPILASSEASEPSRSWSTEALTDGHTPYLMDGAAGEQRTAFIGYHSETPVLKVDLGSPYQIFQINFHTIEISDTIPITLAGNFGTPHQITIEGANNSDFSDAVLLLEKKVYEPMDSGPILMHKFPETTCRYVRIIGNSPDLDALHSTNLQKIPHGANAAPASVYRIGFSEIEVLTRQQNVALNKHFESQNIRIPEKQDILRLTDGHNYYGKILPVRNWMSQLAERHDLEFEQEQISAELSRRYLQQKDTLRRLIITCGLLGLGIIISILSIQMIHRRQFANLRQRFAADLHDEIGANLHTIKLVSELIAKRSTRLPDDVNRLVERIYSVVQRTSAAIRHVSDLQTTGQVHSHLPKELNRTAERILIELNYSIGINGEEFLSQLTPQRHCDLILLYQECLINICRHSYASQVRIFLNACPKQIQLVVSDNGRGLPEHLQNEVTPSLLRRAKLLKASIQVENRHEGGTQVTINLRRRSKLRRALTKSL